MHSKASSVAKSKTTKSYHKARGFNRRSVIFQHSLKVNFTLTRGSPSTRPSITEVFPSSAR